MSLRVVEIPPGPGGATVKILIPEPEGDALTPTVKPAITKPGFFADPAAKLALGFLLIALLILALMGNKLKSDQKKDVTLHQAAGSVVLDNRSGARAIDQVPDVKKQMVSNVTINSNKPEPVQDVPVAGYFYFNNDNGIVYCYQKVQK